MRGPISKDGLQEVLEVTGTQAELAERIGANRQTVNWWFLKGFVPVDRVVSIERATGVDRSRLRPDIFHRDEEAA